MGKLFSLLLSQQFVSWLMAIEVGPWSVLQSNFKHCALFGDVSRGVAEAAEASVGRV